MAMDLAPSRLTSIARWGRGNRIASSGPLVTLLWAGAAVVLSAPAATPDLLFEVRNNAFERFRDVVEVQLGLNREALTQERQLVELGTAGAAAAPVPFVVDASGEQATLAWVVPGITPAGAVRHFAFRPQGSVPGPAAGTDLVVTQTETHVTVRNSYFAVSHRRRGGGGLPDRVVFALSGHEDTRLEFLDRLYRRETRRQYTMRSDAAATATVVLESPVRVIVEARSGYALGSAPAPGNPRAVYRYTYSPYSPVVHVKAVVTRDDEDAWNELHFLHPSREDYHYTRFIVGDPPHEIPMQPKGAKSKGHGGRHWGLMATEDDAVGVGLAAVTCWDASDEFVYYVKGPTPSWTTRRQEFEGALYFGPAVGDLSWFSRWMGPDYAMSVRRAAETGAAAAPADQTGVEAAHVLENDALRVSFADPARGFDCLAIENRLAGPTRFVHTRDDAPGLWRIELRPPYSPPADDAAGKAQPEASCVLTNRDKARCAGRLSESEDGQQLVLEWKGLGLPDEPGSVDVVATVLLRPGHGPAEWRIRVDNRSKTWGLWEVHYPLLASVCPRGEGDALLPRGNWGGQLLRNHRGSWTGSYPSGGCPVQFMAFQRGQAGLYLGAHDDAARAKKLQVTVQQDATVATSAEDMGVPGSDQAAPFPVVVAAYRGDWWGAARIYRQWAAHQAWTQKGWIADRDDIPLRLKELGLWMLGGGMPEGVKPWMLRAEETFPVPVGLHWYNWHVIPFDHTYPEYFPAKTGFDTVVRELVGRGQVMMPYINGRLWDRDIPSFEQGIAAACKQRSGEPYTEVYGSGRRLAPMCPYTKLWQDRVNQIIHGLIHDCGVNAIYLDQIGAARPRLCWDPAHGHPLGGGRHWVDGYRTMLDQVKAQAAANDVGLTTENTAEPYMDNIDAFLTWSPRHDTDVPLLPAVYSGYTLYFSSPQDARDDLEAFIMAHGRDFLWGCQLGWNGEWMMEDAHRDKAEFLTELCRHRLAGKAYLVYGQLLDDLHWAEPVGTVTSTWNRRTAHPATLPAVMGTLWQARDGSLGVFIVNLSPEPQRVRYAISPQAWGASASTWLCSRLTPEGETPWSLVHDAQVERTELLAAHEVRALTLRPADDPAAFARRAAETAKAAGDSAAGDAAQAYLFEQAARDAGLDVRLQEDLLTVARGEPAELHLVVTPKRGAPVPPPLTVRWPDGATGRVGPQSRRGIGGALEARHVFWPKEQADGWTATAVAVSLGTDGEGQESTHELPVLIRRTPTVSVRLGGPAAVRGGESFLLPVELLNNSRSLRRGRVELRTPPGWVVEPSPRIDVGELAAGQRRDLLLRCRAPVSQSTTQRTLSACFVEQAAERTVTVRKSRPRIDCAHFTQPPQVDGDLREWAERAALELGGAGDSVKVEKDYGGREDCSARVMVGWDAQRFYLAAEVTDDVPYQQEDGYQMWQGDCIQLAFRDGPPNREAGYDGTEFEVGLTRAPNGPLVFQWMPAGEPLSDGKLAVVRQDNVTRYEAAVPWTALGVATPGAGKRISWSLTVNDNDGEGFRGWLEWTPGVCGSKDSSEFGWLTLVR